MRGEAVAALFVGHVVIASLVGGIRCAPRTSGAASDTVEIARLERAARSLARTSGCSSTEQCQTAPVGERACGGPRDYVVFCTRSTDTSALNRALAELRQAEIELNKRTNAVSTCEFRMPPEVTVVGGSCRAR